MSSNITATIADHLPQFSFVPNIMSNPSTQKFNFYQPLRFDINRRSDGLLVYIKASLPSKILTKFKLPINIQIIPFEINLRKEKWLFVSIYKPPSQSNIS